MRRQKFVAVAALFCSTVVLFRLLYSGYLLHANRIKRGTRNRAQEITQSSQNSGHFARGTAVTTEEKDFVPEPEISLAKENVILLYTKFFKGPWYLRWNRNFPCYASRCIYTYNKSAMQHADAVVFHDADMPRIMPQRKRSDQLWVYFNMESPINMKHRGDVYNGVFNWTMSYRLDSDVYTPYGSYRPLKCKEQRRDFNKKVSHVIGKTKLIAWVVSACKVPSGRFEYARKLAEYLPIDIFGKCGNFTACPRTGNEFWLGEECKVQLRQYKFYLAFENSLCEDYITEKYWEHGLENGLVPIVLGGANYQKLAIPGSYIDLQDFKTVKRVAEYITYLDNNDTAYNEFFTWKKLYELETPYLYGCALCTALHRHKTHKIYANFDEYWIKNKCQGKINIS